MIVLSTHLLVNKWNPVRNRQLGNLNRLDFCPPRISLVENCVSYVWMWKKNLELSRCRETRGLLASRRVVGIVEVVSVVRGGWDRRERERWEREQAVAQLEELWLLSRLFICRWSFCSPRRLPQSRATEIATPPLPTFAIEGPPYTPGERLTPRASGDTIDWFSSFFTSVLRRNWIRQVYWTRSSDALSFYTVKTLPIVAELDTGSQIVQSRRLNVSGITNAFVNCLTICRTPPRLPKRSVNWPSNSKQRSEFRSALGDGRLKNNYLSSVFFFLLRELRIAQNCEKMRRQKWKRRSGSITGW